jgi:hypothetical protein
MMILIKMVKIYIKDEDPNNVDFPEYANE